MTYPGREVLQTNHDGPTIVGGLNNIPQPRSGGEAWQGHRHELVSFSCLGRFGPLYLNGPENVVALTIGKTKRAVTLTFGKGGIVFPPDERRQPIDILFVQINGRAMPKKHSF